MWVLITCLDPTIRLKAFIVIEQNALAFFTIHDDQMPKVESNEYLQFKTKKNLQN